MEDIILSLVNALPAKLWLLSGWLFIVGGGIVFCLGLFKDNHQTGKTILLWGALSIVAGGIAVFMRDYPVVSAILILIVILRILLWIGEWGLWFASVVIVVFAPHHPVWSPILATAAVFWILIWWARRWRR